LEAEKKEARKELVEELERRIRVLDSNEGEIAELARKKMRKSDEDAEKEERLRTALEEAKRRNGHA
jgi:hydroxyethylthiazole kinase-like sugar kinase family protein